MMDRIIGKKKKKKKKETTPVVAPASRISTRLCQSTLIL